jgi:PTS system mannose-specific IIC component
MTFLQAAILSLFCYFGALTTPWTLGATGGWYTITRPFIAGFISGLVLGDLQTGILTGITIQAVYIGIITPGGAVPADLSFVSYLGIPLALVAGASPEVAVSLSVGFGVIGIAAWQLLSVGNAGWAHLCDRYAQEGNMQGIIRVNYLAQIGTFILRGILPFLILYYGSGIAEDFINFLNVQIPWLMDFLGVLGGALPAVGIAILLFQIATSNHMLVWFLLGWVFVSFLKVPLVGVAVLGGIITVLYYLFFSKTEAEA